MGERQLIARNKRASFDYHIKEKLEAGIVLEGCEVKSLRAGHITFKDSYARVKDNELYLFNCHILPYAQASAKQPHPERDRKLLLHRKELDKWLQKVATKGLSIIPLQVYIQKGRVKVEIGLCESKKQHDKRASLKDKDTKRDIDRAIKSRW